jgi:tRNA 2-thiouridine synthesizing protein A
LETKSQSAPCSVAALASSAPVPIARTKEEIEKIEVGQTLRVEADDPAAEEDISRRAREGCVLGSGNSWCDKEDG